MTSLQKSLWKNFGKQMLLSIAIFFALFLILYSIEWIFPSMRHQLLQWEDAAFLVGIPASVVGVAYVLTIRDPRNYTGFAGGVLMAILLAAQFYLQGNIDLVVLQLAVFVPFLLSSYIRWRRLSLQPAAANQVFVPQWLSKAYLCLSLGCLIGLVAADYALLTLLVQHNQWHTNILIKLLSGVMVASSVLANFILIYQKIDAWLWWVVYALAGMCFYALIGNIFSLLLFTVFLIVNANAGIAWIKLRNQHRQ